MSSDDKTRFDPRKLSKAAKPTTPSETGQEDGADDDNKTRIARPKLENNDKTVIAASQRARKLEQKLKLQQAMKMQEQVDTDDRTRIIKRTESKSKPASKLKLNAPTESPKKDTTRFNTTLVRDLGSDDKTVTYTGERIVATLSHDEIERVTSRPTSLKHSDEELSREAEIAQYGMLKQRFVLEKVLGAGGMGVVYKAKDLLKIEAQDSDPYVAVKVLGEEFKSHPDAFIALQRESRKSQRIAHPNIVNVHDFDRDGDTVFMTMEFLDGYPLDELISKYRGIGLPRDDVWQILKGISSALIHAHNENIIHSDFKPGNIFFTDKNVAKVFDFGIARAVANAENLEESKDDKTVFDAGSLGALTPAYASLEMLEGSSPDIRDDIYALGCIAYELFTGEHPYNRVNALEASHQKLKAKRIPGITKRQWRTIEQAIAFKREDRIASVGKFWHDLTAKKRRSGFVVVSLMFVMMATAMGAYYQFGLKQTNDYDSSEVRGEIELKLRLELQTKAIEKLLKVKSYSASWEQEIWQQIQSARELMGEENAWLIGVENTLYEEYVTHIKDGLAQEDINNTARWLSNASRYTADSLLLEEYSAQLDLIIEAQRLAELEREREAQALKEQKKQAAQKVVAVAERRSAYNAALTSVNEQLSCRSNINMKDLDVAITKLRSLDFKQYSRAEPQFVADLAICLEKIGRSFPERAKDSKKAAMRIFEGSTIIANIKIIPKDVCSLSLAGLGARGNRAICRDRIPRVGMAPVLVVVPANGKTAAFAISKYEISIEEFNQYCTAAEACKPISGKNSSLPVTNISVKMANDYIRWLSTETKRKYSLPTESKWFYAAKAGKNVLDSNRNCSISTRGIEKGDTLLKTTVGRQNSWGLVNHIGNAQEWVKRGSSYKVVGASHLTPMADCNYDFIKPHNGDEDPVTGFRIVRALIAPKT